MHQRPGIATVGTVHDVIDNLELRRFEILDGDELGAIAEYDLLDDSIVFTHTETMPGHEGRGVAKRLVTAALGQARQRGLSVVPVCPYVRKVIADNPSLYLDLVPRAARSKFGLPDDPPPSP
jgi:predicted GNAT family acetyltransferase